MSSKGVFRSLLCGAILLSFSSVGWAAGPLFMPAQIFQSGGGAPGSIAVADVDRDGKPDLLVANYCGSDPNCNGMGSVGVLLGNGDGTFRTAFTYESGGNSATSVAVGDLNGDGKPDLVLTNACRTPSDCDLGVVSVLLGNGDGTFQSAVIYESGGKNAISVVVGDVNGDGKLDLIAANYCVSSVSCGGGSLGVLLGNGDGTFQSPQSYNSGGADTASVTVTDLNGDTKPDLVVSNVQGIAVLLGNGNGTFQAARAYDTGGSDTHAVAVGDVNKDGIPDLIAADECNGGGACDHGTVAVLLGNGDGTFQTPQTYNSSGTWAFAVAVGDVDGDGNLDLLVTNECFSYTVCDSGIVGVFLGNGDGTFQPVQQYKSGGRNPISMALADVNGDGGPDLVVPNSIANTGIGVLLNNAGAHHLTATTLVASENPAPLGKTIFLTATVTNDVGGPVAGTITFLNHSTKMGTAPLLNGVAVFPFKFDVNGHKMITAVYPGDLYNAPSSSPTLPLDAARFPIHARVEMTSSLNPSHAGQPVTFTAVLSTYFGKIPDGELVIFEDLWDKTTLGTVALVGGKVSLTTSSLTAIKKHTIRATYEGDSIYARDTKHLMQVVIQ